MQIMDMLEQMGGVQSMAREFGVSEAQAASGAAALLPAILGGFKKQTQAQPAGLEGLIGMLGGLGITDHLGVGDAAFGADPGGDVVGIALALTLVEVGADREIAAMREPPRGLDVELAPAGEMVDQHDARKGARTRRPGHVRGDRGSLVAMDGHVLAGHASVERHRTSSIGCESC